jgi:SAM-dependent methyltransferase
MIGRQPLPDRFVEWNARWGAPFGLPAADGVPLHQRHTRPDPAYGPFAFQLHSGTRAFEYPWAYFAAGTGTGCRVLDVGGGMSGLQFVFALEGCAVVTVDPFDNDSGGWPATRWRVGPDLHERLNAVFGTRVRLVCSRLQQADLAPGSVDRVVCLSVLEHLPADDARDLVARAARLLAPGGLLVATVDLFLDLKPFGVLDRNGYGTNLDVCRLVDGTGLDLVQGDPRELYGFPEFDRDRLVARLPELYLSPTYPCVSQALVLRRPA